MTLSHAIIIKLIRIYENGLLGPFIQTKELVLLLYLMKESGESSITFPLINYESTIDRLNVILRKMLEEKLLVFADDKIFTSENDIITLSPHSMTEASEFLVNFPDTVKRLKNVTDLVQGFEDETGLKMLTETHWFVKNHMTAKRFKIGYERLIEKGWI